MLSALLTLAFSCQPPPPPAEELPVPPRPGEPEGFVADLCAAALERTRHQVLYDPSYRTIPYPGGDVPDHLGVCTDVLIRAYRALDIDLQREVHEEMAAHFEHFPRRWGLSRPDPNIDHRRVPNLAAFFGRRGETLPASDDPADYLPADIVTWDVFGRPHIGVVVNRRSRDRQRSLVVHNIGAGPRLEDCLFTYPVTGHYRYYGDYGARRPPGG